MTRTSILTTGLLVFLLAQVAHAQAPVGQGTRGQSPQSQRAQSPRTRYQPTRPTVSPYLNLLRPNESAVPNYYSFVRPQLQAQENQQRQQAINVQQQTAIGTLDREVLQITQPAARTGGGGNFRQYSHFYPALGRP